MPRALLAVALSALSTTVPSTHGSQAPEGPRAVVRSAGAAVRGDSVARLRARWQTRLARDSSDRAAALGLATLARLTYDYPLAERLYNRLITGAGRVDPYAVYARLGVAQGYDEYGSMTDIKRLLADALGEARALRDRAAEAEALLWVGYVGSRSTGLETALAYYDTALRVMPRGAIDLEAATRCRQAHTLIVLGRAKSVARLTSATAFARQVDDPRARAPCVRARAIALGHGGHADSAAAVYGEFADVLQRAHDRSGRALTLIWQAVSLREDLADYGDAREVLAEAQVDAVLSHNQYAQAVAQLFLGQLFLALNDYHAAAGYLDKAVAASAAVADTEALMVSRSWRALVSLAAGDYPAALMESLVTLDFFRREGDLENQSEVVQTLANIAIRQRNWPAAEQALDSSEALLRRLGTVQWRTEQWLERGRLALYRGDYPTAARAFARQLEGLDSSAHLQRVRGPRLPRRRARAARRPGAGGKGAERRRGRAGPLACHAERPRPESRRVPGQRLRAERPERQLRPRARGSRRRRTRRGRVRAGGAAPRPRAGRPAAPEHGAGAGGVGALGHAARAAAGRRGGRRGPAARPHGAARVRHRRARRADYGVRRDAGGAVPPRSAPASCRRRTRSPGRSRGSWRSSPAARMCRPTRPHWVGCCSSRLWPSWRRT